MSDINMTGEVKEINLLDMMGGAVGERVSYELSKIMRNCKDLNTEPKKARTLTIEFSITPTETRDSAAILVSVKSKLVPVRALDSTLLIGGTSDDPVVMEYTPMDMETFTINLQTYFAPDGDRDELVQLAGTVRADQGVTVADDGMTQQVTARSGISLIQQVSVPNPVELVPFRTFTEVEQPASPFVFRMRRDGDTIMAALFAADADMWKREAILNIRDYFGSELPEEMRDDVIILA